MSIFVIRNKTSGKHYHAYTYSYDRHTRSYTTPAIEYADKGWGKQFKDLGKLKTHILYLIGIMMPPADILKKTRESYQLHYKSEEYTRIHNELKAWHDSHPGYQSVPEFMQNDYPLDKIPDDWEVIEVIDKKTKNIAAVDFNPVEYAMISNKLRVLTDTYGSSVRDLYKKLDKDGKISDFRYVAVVGIDPSKDFTVNNWWDMVKADQAPVNDALKSMGLKRGESVKSSKADGIAVAFKSQEHAVWFSLTYSGADKVSLIDMTLLETLVLPATIS